MVPMAIPTFGGMLIQSMTMFVVPVLQCWWRETVERRREKKTEVKFLSRLQALPLSDLQMGIRHTP